MTTEKNNMPTIEQTFARVFGDLHEMNKHLTESTGFIRERDQDIRDGLIFKWMCLHPDEAASAVEDAYNAWDASRPEDWDRQLRDYLDDAMEKLP